MVWITTGKSLYVTQKQMTHKHVWHETVIHMWQTTAHDTQAFLTWNSCPCVANNRKWHTIMFGMKQLSTCANNSKWHTNIFILKQLSMWQTTANDIQAFLTWNSYPYVANNSKWHTIIFDMKHLSICDKQQQMTYKHFRHETVTIGGKQQQMKHKHLWHETVVHMWQTTANDIQSFLTWNICPYVANNSKWHILTWNILWHETVIHMWQTTANDTQAFWHETVIHMWQTTANDTPWNSYPYVANNSKWHRSIFDMKQLSICSKQQQMTYNHFWHETFVHMWQTTANDIQSFSTWNSYHRWQTTANETQASLTWNSCPYVANNSKWHTNMFDMKQLSICGKQQQMTQKHFWHETVVHMWQTTANDTQACLTWNSYPYVANNSKWHTSIFDMKELSICGNNSKRHTIMFDMKQLSICGKQQQMTHKHVSHETVIHMWQTTANDTQTCLPWNSYPSVANNSKWHRSIFDMKQLSICSKQQQMTHKHVWHETAIHMWQTTANDIQACLAWNSYPCMSNNSKWHTRIFDMKRLSMFYLFIYL